MIHNNENEKELALDNQEFNDSFKVYDQSIISTPGLRIPPSLAFLTYISSNCLQLNMFTMNLSDLTYVDFFVILIMQLIW